MLDFISNGSVDLFGSGKEWKIQNENICLEWDSNPHPASPWQESQRLKARSHQRPDQPRSLPLWKNGRIGNERALIGESVCWSKIQWGLVGPALRGRGERDKFFNRLKNGRGWSRSPRVVCWAWVQRGGRWYSVGWSYFDRVWSAIQRK